MRKKEFNMQNLNTIYFGGGSPGVLKIEEYEKIFDIIKQHFSLARDIEITLELNPEDINQIYLDQLYQLGINRLSVGVQSLMDEELRFMKRISTKVNILKSLNILSNSLFHNYSFDLIFGTPYSSIKSLESTLNTLIDFYPTHFSVYNLTVEKKTLLQKWVSDQKVTLPNQAENEKQYFFVLDLLGKNNYLQYEISNFCKKGFESKHNSNYWTGKPYLGLGPSAHSYDGNKRRFYNVYNNHVYISKMESNHIPSTIEMLNDNNVANEMIITHLRTTKGLDLENFSHIFGIKMTNRIKENIKKADLLSKHVLYDGSNLKLKQTSFFISDTIIKELIF